MTVDYHKPNQVATQIVAAVPGVVSLTEQINPSPGTLYAAIDLANTFLSIPVNEDYQKKFALSWQDQQYSFNVLPRGMSTPALDSTSTIGSLGCLSTSLGTGTITSVLLDLQPVDLQ